MEIALQMRNMEIELFWKRFNQFWLISAAALAGYVAVRDRGNNILLLIACFGMVSSFAWTLLNVGAKWWCDAWEIRLASFEDKSGPQKVEGILPEGFIHPMVVNRKRIFLTPMWRFSVTEIAIAISTFCTLMWAGLAVIHFAKSIGLSSIPWQAVVDSRAAVLFGGSVFFCVLLLFLTYRSADE